MRHLPTTTKGERGGAMIEFAFSTLIWVPLLLGVIGIGTELVREIQVTEVCRDASRMYAYGVDFTQLPNQNLVVQIAPNLGITPTSGNGAVILSTVKVISAADCQAGGFTGPDYSGCINFNQPVFVSQIVIGNGTQYKSAFGTPNPSTVSQNTMLTKSSDQVPGVAALIPMNPNNTPFVNLAYIGEVFVNNTDLAGTMFGGSVITAKSIF